MDTTNPTLVILGAVALLVILVLIGMAMSRQRRSKRLQEQFGPEYERTLKKMGDKREAESDLEERVAHVNALNIRTLTAEEVNRYALQWQDVQREFVDEPLLSLQKADRLIREVMKARGYPVEDFEQRVADISVHYPELVADYRGMHHIAIKESSETPNTEEIRKAMIHGRALFENLISTESREEVKQEVNQNQKEKI
jgi:FtsZ-interacting cell division protein ZipA